MENACNSEIFLDHLACTACFRPTHICSNQQAMRAIPNASASISWRSSWCVCYRSLTCLFTFSFLTHCVTFVSRICWCLLEYLLLTSTCAMFPTTGYHTTPKQKDPPPCLILGEMLFSWNAVHFPFPKLTFGDCGQSDSF